MSYMQRCFFAVQCTADICVSTFTKLQTQRSIRDSRVLVIAFILIFFYRIYLLGIKSEHLLQGKDIKINIPISFQL